MAVKTAARTLDIFELFSSEQRPLNLSEVANGLQIPMSSCFALVRTLEDRGYIYTLASHKVMYPTKRLMGVANKIATGDPVLAKLESIMSALRDDTGETVALSKRQGSQVVYLDVYDSRNSIRYYAEAGDSKWLHCSSAGKAFLGALDQEELSQEISRLALQRMTEHTLTTSTKLRQDIDCSRKRGWYCNNSESVIDLIGVAITFMQAKGRYAVSIAGPTHRLQPRLEAVAHRLLVTKAAIDAMD